MVSEQIHDQARIKKEVESFVNSLRFEAEVIVIDMEEDAIAFYMKDWTVKIKNRADIRNLVRQQTLIHGNRPSLTIPDYIDEIEVEREKVLDESPSRFVKEYHLHHQESKRQSFATILTEKYAKLNKVIYKNSRKSQLVLITLPEPYETEEDEDCRKYWEYLETLTQGLEQVMLIHGTGTEIIGSV